MKRKVLTLFLALGPVLFSQVAETTVRERITKIVRVHGNASIIASLAVIPGVSVEGDNQLRVIVIKGIRSDVAAVERTIQELDTAAPATSEPKNIELVVYVIGGSMDPIPGVPEASVDALTPVLKQLRAVFPYKNYQTLSTMVVRSGQDSKAINSGMMKTVQSNGNSSELVEPSVYHIQYNSARISQETPPVIHLNGFHFGARIPVKTGSDFHQVDVGTETDVDLREGQKVVVANSNLGNANISLFLVLTARLVQ